MVLLDYVIEVSAGSDANLTIKISPESYEMS